MGGKKKTKWRKLPLEEFTKDCPKLHERRRSEANKANAKKSEEEKVDTRIPTQEDIEDSSLSLNQEYNENQDGVWYPTHYLIYNPVEVPMYPNYVMPSDTNCYYYPSNDVNSLPEYAPVPYQEYVPPVKDTIYLLFPASALRPPQTSPFDWRNRRRRRRYGGYAEYAVIPGKSNANVKKEDKREINFNPEKSNIQSSEIKTSAFADLKQSYSNERYQNSTEEPDVVKAHIKAEKTSDLKNNMGLSNGERKDTNSNKTKKNIHACGVHSNYPERKESDINLKNQDTSKNETLPLETSDDSSIHISSVKQDDTSAVSKQGVENKQSCDPKESFEDNFSVTNNQNKINCSFEQKTSSSDIMHNSINNHSTMKIQSDNSYSNNPTDTLSDCGFYTNPEPEFSFDMENKDLERDKNDFIQTSLPDILNTLNKIPDPHNIKTSSQLSITNGDKSKSEENHLTETVSNNASINLQPTVSSLSNTDAVYRENEINSKQQSKSQPAHINSSIYKLAFDESLTDQSDSESRSPSPIDPQSQMPSSLISHEINIYEADSGDEAGSEDLELIPHRYESESFLNKSKHVYENKLSLAVELLRTKESLPYDSQFKRLPEDNFQDSTKYETDSTGAVNLGFVDDSNFLNSFEMKSKNADSNKFDQTVITNQCQTRTSSSQNVTFEIPLENSLTSSCEIADEAVMQPDGQQEKTDEVSAGYRGGRFRHIFSPSSSLLNPWNCCIVM